MKTKIEKNKSKSKPVSQSKSTMSDDTSLNMNCDDWIYELKLRLSRRAACGACVSDGLPVWNPMESIMAAERKRINAYLASGMDMLSIVALESESLKVAQ